MAPAIAHNAMLLSPSKAEIVVLNATLFGAWHADQHTPQVEQGS